MKILVFRIDDRLIHGQVLEGWLNKLGIKCIVVVNNSIAFDEMQISLIKMVVPNYIEIYIKSIDDFVKNINNNFFLDKEIMVVVSSPKDAFSIIDKGIDLKSLNVGGMRFCNGKEQILEFLNVDEEDCKYFDLICKKNIFIEGRPLPDSEKIDIMKILKYYHFRK